MNMVSPDNMLEAAREQMLDGREPVTENDWMLVMNFMAANIQKGLEESACNLLRLIYNMPLSTKQVEQIARYQAERKDMPPTAA